METFSSSDSNGLNATEKEVDETDLLGAGAERRTAELLLQKSTPMDTVEQTVQEILKTERKIVREAMLGYSFHPALNTK